ncbi:MAG: hypothetical protein ACREVX_09410 [Clostridium sp.]|uniref:hypothetical protein n=1 Tax=Clostridium sp. TaxID=1506 RepID=UPI003D6CE586
MVTLENDKLENINGGDISLDLGTISPWEIGKEFGEHVIYPYVYKPVKNWWNS